MRRMFYTIGLLAVLLAAMIEPTMASECEPPDKTDWVCKFVPGLGYRGHIITVDDISSPLDCKWHGYDRKPLAGGSWNPVYPAWEENGLSNIGYYQLWNNGRYRGRVGTEEYGEENYGDPGDVEVIDNSEWGSCTPFRRDYALAEEHGFSLGGPLADLPVDKQPTRPRGKPDALEPLKGKLFQPAATRGGGMPATRLKKDCFGPTAITLDMIGSQSQPSGSHFVWAKSPTATGTLKFMDQAAGPSCIGVQPYGGTDQWWAGWLCDRDMEDYLSLSEGDVIPVNHFLSKCTASRTGQGALRVKATCSGGGQEE